MMQVASAGLFELIVAEDVDRLARDQADWHAVRKRLELIGADMAAGDNELATVLRSFIETVTFVPVPAVEAPMS
jgi:DNA invertase Pin-like site-specific DNA recombinase